MSKSYKKITQQTKTREVAQSQSSAASQVKEPTRGPGGGKIKANRGANKPVSRELDVSNPNFSSTFLEKITRTLGLGSFMSLLVITSMAYKQMPDLIPKGFNRFGEVVGWGSHGRIWLLCIIGFFVYLALMTMSYAPQVLRYGSPVTKQTAPILFRYGRIFVNCLDVIIQAQFITLNYYTWQVAIGNLERSNPMLNNVYVGLILVSVAVFYFVTKRVKVK